jgi:ribosomal protein S18 acetylase RimI-like enzyme
MSAFDEIAKDVPAIKQDESSLARPPQLDEPRDSRRFLNAIERVEELVLNAKDQKPHEFVTLLRQVCLDEHSRDIVLQLCGEEAQVVVDAIQLVSTLTPLQADTCRITF